MRITIATGPIFPVPAVLGGAVPRLWEGLVREFASRGHQVTVFAREFPGQEREETIDGVRYVRWGGYRQSTSIKRDLVMCLLYALGAARKVPSADVVVTNDFWLPAVLPLLNASAGNVVASIARFPKRQFLLYAKCAAIAPVSEAVARGIREQTPSLASKLVVVPNCIDANFLGPVREKASSGPVRILFAGRIHPEKGLLLLADALHLLAAGTRAGDVHQGGHSREWECLLVGPVKEGEGGGGEGFAEMLRSRLRGVPARIEPPIYDPRALCGKYDCADILVYPSVAEQGESFGLAPLEGMARGVPPVLSGLPVFREYLEPGVNGLLFDHRSQRAAENLAKALRHLLDDRETRARLGNAARDTAERFSPAVIADKYLQLFEKVISEA